MTNADTSARGCSRHFCKSLNVSSLRHISLFGIGTGAVLATAATVKRSRRWYEAA